MGVIEIVLSSTGAKAKAGMATDLNLQELAVQ